MGERGVETGGEGRREGLRGGEGEGVLVRAQSGVVEGRVGDGFADVFDGALDGFHDGFDGRDVDALLADVFHFGRELGPRLHEGVAQLPEFALIAHARFPEFDLFQARGEGLVGADDGVAFVQREGPIVRRAGFAGSFGVVFVHGELGVAVREGVVGDVAGCSEFEEDSLELLDFFHVFGGHVAHGVASGSCG